jgi:hypothetical protein
MTIYAHPSSVLQGLGYGVQQGTALSNQESTMQSFREQREKEMAQSYLSSALQAQQMAAQAYAMGDRARGDNLEAQAQQYLKSIGQTKTGPGVNDFVFDLSQANKQLGIYQSTSTAENRNPFTEEDIQNMMSGNNGFNPQATSTNTTNANQTNANTTNANAIPNTAPNTTPNTTPDPPSFSPTQLKGLFPNGINIKAQSNTGLTNLFPNGTASLYPQSSTTNQNAGFNPQAPQITPQNLNIASALPLSQPPGTGTGTGTETGTETGTDTGITTTKTGSKFTGNFIDWSSMVDPNAYKDPEVKNALLEMKKRHPNGQLADPKLQQMINDVSQIGQGINAKLNQGYSDLFNELYKHYGYETTKTDPDGTVRKVRALDRNGENIYRNQILEWNKIKDMLAPISMPGWARNIATPEDLVAIDKLRNYEEQQKNSSFGLKLNYYTPDQLESYLNNLKGAYSQLNNIDFKAQAQALGSSANVLRGDNPYNPSQSGGATDFGLSTIQLAPAVEKMTQFQMPQFEEPKPQTLDTSASNVTTTKTPRGGGGGGGSKQYRTLNYLSLDGVNAVATADTTNENVPQGSVIADAYIGQAKDRPEGLTPTKTITAAFNVAKSRMKKKIIPLTVGGVTYNINDSDPQLASQYMTRILWQLSNNGSDSINFNNHKLLFAEDPKSKTVKMLGIQTPQGNYTWGQVFNKQVKDLTDEASLEAAYQKFIDMIIDNIQVPRDALVGQNELDPHVFQSHNDDTILREFKEALIGTANIVPHSEAKGYFTKQIKKPKSK